MEEEQLQDFRRRWRKEIEHSCRSKERRELRRDKRLKVERGEPSSGAEGPGGAWAPASRQEAPGADEEKNSGGRALRSAPGAGGAARFSQRCAKGMKDLLPEAAGPSRSAGSCSENSKGLVGSQRCESPDFCEAVQKSADLQKEASSGGRKVDYFYLAESLLEGRTSPLRDRIEVENSRRRRGRDLDKKLLEQERNSESRHQRPNKENLLDLLIQDLNEINEIPFFDVQLPYELALSIFQYLGRRELGRCAQVSKLWKVLAEDEVLWYRLCQQEGFLANADISDYTSWKAVLRDHRQTESTLRTNWKNRVGAVSQLQYELGKILCDAHSSDGLVIAGYTSGAVRLWDFRSWDGSSSYLESTHSAVAEPGIRPQVSLVRVGGALAVAAYEDGTLDVWSPELGQEPVHHYQHNRKLQAIALEPEGAAVATASGFQVRVESPNEKGYWQTSSQSELQKKVNFLQLVPDLGRHPIAIAAAEDTVYLLQAEEEVKTLHSIYGHPVTCLDASANQVAFGVRSFGWLMNDGNKVHVYSLQSGQLLMTLGNSTAEFTCLNLRDSPPHLLVTGNKDRRHPVRHIRFGAHTLVTANIPDEKNPRGASIMDDDLTAHRRHRGIIYVYDFSVDRSAPDHVLPICRSSYVESIGYSYNIGLTVPYDHI
ncbi:F-box/WD repeat-containing protein 8 isoform X2 [Latimeria chalumnae]|uniref:F-box/WD repeat-containing protein 8 isoform X2 n=1 Tax=Latimeria chalumnae TaxID=7897 RepID=UPI00313CEBF7